MRRAYIGFSSPIGFDYKNEADRTVNDSGSSPNPILYGTTGLLVLFDEIWFACESLCPQNMRTLPYVYFLDKKRSGDGIDWAAIDLLSRSSSSADSPSLNDMFREGYSEVERYAVKDARYDNHTHGLQALGIPTNGNPSFDNLLRDLAIVEAYHELDLSPVFNPLTVKYLLPSDIAYQEKPGETGLTSMEVTTGILTVPGLKDLASPEGPYHPAYEHLRTNIYVKDFRNWVDQEAHRWHNREPDEIISDLRHEIHSFNNSTLAKEVAPEGLREVAVELGTSSLLDLIPGSATVHKAIAIGKGNRKKSKARWLAYCAQSKFTLMTELEGL